MPPSVAHSLSRAAAVPVRGIVGGLSRAARLPLPSRADVTCLDDAVMFDDPYPVYAALRREAPVSRCRARLLVRGTGYMLTRFEDVAALYTDPRFSTDMIKHFGLGKVSFAMPPTLRLLTDSMVFKDEPDHKRLRLLVHKAFTPKLVAGMEPHITQIVHDQVDRLAAKGEVDLVEDFAIKVPLAVIATMMGVSDADRDTFHHWCASMNEASGGRPVAVLKSLPSANRLIRFFSGLADQGRLNPNEGLISALVAANEDGDKLTDREVLAMTFLLLLAGHDTTANLIGSSVLALLEHPDQLALIREDPAVLETGVEELLRYTTPVPFGTTRFALEDVEMSGTVIPAGAQVLGMIISANRDEEAFPDPDVLDLTREPNRHLAFSLGPHYCLGNQLARMEGKIALSALATRFRHLELTVPQAQLRYKPSTALRGLTSLPMRLR